MSTTRPYICMGCQKVFKKMSEYIKHNRIDHPKIDHRATTLGQMSSFLADRSLVKCGTQIRL